MGEILDAHVSVQRKSGDRCILVSMLKTTGVICDIIPFLIGSLHVGKFLEVVLDAQLVHGFVDHADIVAEYPQ